MQISLHFDEFFCQKNSNFYVGADLRFSRFFNSMYLGGDQESELNPFNPEEVKNAVCDPEQFPHPSPLASAQLANLPSTKWPMTKSTLTDWVRDSSAKWQRLCPTSFSMEIPTTLILDASIWALLMLRANLCSWQSRISQSLLDQHVPQPVWNLLMSSEL